MTTHGTAVVTGASRGIGAALAERLAGRGYRVILVGREVETLEAIRRGLDTPSRHLSLTADLSSEQEIDSLVERISRETDRLDLLVLNAGYAADASIETTETEVWDYTFSVNVRAPFLLCRKLLSQLRSAPSGRIIAIGSVVATAAYPHQGAYTASKHALRGFLRVLAKEVHHDGIVVQMIHPGGVATEMVGALRPDIDPAEYIATTEVADAMEFLLNQRGNAVTDEISIRRATKSP